MAPNRCNRHQCGYSVHSGFPGDWEGSTLALVELTPLLGPDQVGGPGLRGVRVLAGRSVCASFCVALQRQGLTKGLGGGVREFHLSPLLSAVRMESGQGLFISVGGTAGVCGGLDTEQRFYTHRISCTHP